MKRGRVYKQAFEIPIYDAKVWLIVADDISKPRRKMEYLFGPAPREKDYQALLAYSGGHNFALFIEPRVVSLKVVAHEVFHLTHRIMDWVEANFDSNHHEQGALLHAYLMELVCRELKVKS